MRTIATLVVFALAVSAGAWAPSHAANTVVIVAPQAQPRPAPKLHRCVNARTHQVGSCVCAAGNRCTMTQ